MSSDPPSVRQRARDMYRDSILEAAERVFAARGFAGTRMSDVAREAGLGTGTLYNYFKNKQDIFRCLLEMHISGFFAALERAQGEPAAPLEQLRTLVRATLEQLEQQRAIFAIFIELGAVTESGIRRVGGDLAEQSYRRYLHIFERVIGVAVDAGQLRSDIAPDELTALLTGSINGVVRRWFMSGESDSLAASADRILDVFLNGVAS